MATTASDALAGDHSIVLFDNVASAEECRLLSDVAKHVADVSATKTHDSDGQVVQEGRFRGHLTDCFDEESQTLCDSVLCRAVARVKVLLPSLLSRYFGDLDLRESILHNEGLVFSKGEPAINIYTCGGRFRFGYQQTKFTRQISKTKIKMLNVSCLNFFCFVLFHFLRSLKTCFYHRLA